MASGISIDITERKEAEKALKMAKELAEAANQAKTEFLANMRHDLRTPFNGILGLTECMEKEETDPEKKESLSLVVESARVLLKQLNEIFEFLHLESGKLPVLEKEFDLYDVLDDVSAIVLPSIKNKEIDFNLVTDDKLPQRVIGDRVRTQRILLNLMTNAIKFTQKGYVNLTVSAKHKPNQRVVVIFLIEDTGMGIPKDKKNIIFERFNRLTPAYSGVYEGKGLGLRIVKQFLDEINGRSYLTSQVNQGTQVKVLIPYQLPLLEPEEMENQSATFLTRQSLLTGKKTAIEEPHHLIRHPTPNHDVPSLPTTNYHVLLVEDNPVAAKVARNILLQQGCQVDFAEDGKMALECVEQHLYDLIFMDIGLPDMSGFEVTKHIRSHRLTSIRQIPVVALTAHADADNQQECSDSQINLVLSKPLTSTQAIEALNMFIPRRQKSINPMPESTQ